MKYADRSNWSRIENKSFAVHHVQDSSFQGSVVVLNLHQVRTRLVIPYQGQNICIADDGYVWVQHFPEGEHFTVTAMVDAEGKVVQWYIDIIHRSGETDQGIPWYEDLFLDIVALPNGDYFTMDEDELTEALHSGEINDEQYHLAWATQRRIVGLLDAGEFELLNEAEKWV